MRSNKYIKFITLPIVPLGLALYLYGFFLDNNFGSLIMGIGGLLFFIPLMNYSKQRSEKKIFKAMYLLSIIILSIISIFLVITLFLLF